jgi:hypothetical protein
VKLFLKPAFIAALGAAAFVAACGSSGSPTTPTTPVAAPTITENFNGILPIGGLKFYSFTIAQNGTVNITLVSVTGDGVPGSVTLALGLGHPAGTGCNATGVNTTTQTTAPQITSTSAPGVWCVSIADVGNLTAPANFAISIAHP